MKKLYKFILCLIIAINVVAMKNINIFAYNRNIDNYTIERRGDKSVKVEVTVQFMGADIKISQYLLIDDVDGYLHNVSSIKCSSRGDLPSKYKTPFVHNYSKRRVDSYTMHISAEVLSAYVNSDGDTINISEIIEYDVESPGPYARIKSLNFK